MPPLILEPGRAERHYWADLWRYRELFAILAWRDIAVRYKQTAIGILWALLQPFATMAVMTLVFGKIANLPSEGATPYPILVFAALLPWQLFANSLSAAAGSIVANAPLVAKVYFPRMLIPAGAVAVAFADFLVALALLGVLMAACGFAPDWRIVCLPLFTAAAMLAALGPGLLITALNVQYRDFRYVIPFLVQFGLYISPVGFSSAVVRERLGDTAFLLYSLNPMVGVIDGFRWCLLGGQTPIHWPAFSLSMAFAALLLAAGIALFRRTERTFADVI